MPTDLVTLEEVNTYTDVDLSGTHPLDYLNAVIGVVSDHVRAYCLGTLFEPTVIEDERTGSYVHGRRGQLTVKLKHVPLISVTSLSYKIGNTATTLDTTEADLDQVNGYIYLLWYGPLYRVRDKWVTVTTYMAGHTSIPDMVVMSAALLVLEWIEADDAAADGVDKVVKKYRIGNYAEEYSITEGVVGNLGLGTTRSIRAAMLLRPYRKTGVV